MFYDREATVNCETERGVGLPAREERRGEEVQAKEKQTKVQSEKFPAQKPRDGSVACSIADLRSRGSRMTMTL